VNSGAVVSIASWTALDSTIHDQDYQEGCHVLNSDLRPLSSLVIGTSPLISGLSHRTNGQKEPLEIIVDIRLP